MEKRCAKSIAIITMSWSDVRLFQSLSTRFNVGIHYNGDSIKAQNPNLDICEWRGFEQKVIERKGGHQGGPSEPLVGGARRPSKSLLCFLSLFGPFKMSWTFNGNNYPFKKQLSLSIEGRDCSFRSHYSWEPSPHQQA